MCCQLRPRPSAFQSPLHRGSSSTAIPGGKCGSREVALSVPSSSGKTLQPAPTTHRQNRHVFQSPLHRGRLFNIPPLSSDTARCFPFSPLFIGEDSSTITRNWARSGRNSLSVPSSSGKTLQRRNEHDAKGQLDFQSPLHRGRLFNQSSQSAARADIELSVPSSSGKTLQLAT